MTDGIRCLQRFDMQGCKQGEARQASWLRCVSPQQFSISLGLPFRSRLLMALTVKYRLSPMGVEDVIEQGTIAHASRWHESATEYLMPF